MKILHTVSGIWKHSGGPAEVIPLLCENLHRLGNTVSIATLAGDLADAALACERQGVVIHRFGITCRRRPWYSRSLRRGLRQLINEADIVHGNGMWEYMNWSTGAEAIRRKKPYIVSFHGSIMHPAVNWHLRHRIAWNLLDGRYIERAACLHACTDEELLSIREIGLRNPVAVIPNGIQLWPSCSESELRENAPAFIGRHTLLFLSRIHPSKGVYNLVEAWCSLAHIPDSWQLLIVGPGQPEHIKRLRVLIESKPLNCRVVYLGPLFGARRILAFQACAAFVCPSHTENFGVVVGEALACGKPVIATHGMPWADLIVHKCGWWIPNSIDALRDAILEAIQTSDSERAAMGQRGKKLVLANYTWKLVTQKMCETYMWVLGGGPAPSWVHAA